ncbi:phospholipase D family protein [Dolosigranulum pigrum]|uniref:phospholipase D family protein n=1 Tax=Dolosigranulum pigrum TaxID=29394 RepID=UPI001AD87B0B|nr:phospholipase D family protein [Dolosigranulum pigrum]QTJ43830.1 NgoFVII family restriction endonuclease [Dolosigranulum pigrum]QTJ47254.1 NgoFVII family restriction endonuclease [Dolosigranulum pigrum]QTJ57227.1 NgoFVII family restriction endonuclease [Dolosigranulum pigrum]QTJ60762.1 NgoFVII family restriction endonuclease [Dolosigranulum pigrum]
MLYDENLYQHTFKQHLPASNLLKIISGFASPSFTRRVLDEFKHVKIELYIGMTQQGLSQTTRQAFTTLYTDYPDRLKVYYQYKSDPTHIKLYEICYNNNSLCTFVGSANFTVNGFERYRELLTVIYDDTNRLFEKQRERSLEATDKRVGSVIPVIDEMEDENLEADDFIKDNQKKMHPRTWLNDQFREYHYMRHPFSTFSKGYVDVDNYIEIPLVLPSDNLSKGINAGLYGKEAYLSETGGFSFANFFGEDLNKLVKFQCDDGQLLTGIVEPRRSNRLKFLPSIYDYIAQRIGIVKNQPITIKKLDQYGRRTIKIFKIDEQEYELDFNNEE